MIACRLLLTAFILSYRCSKSPKKISVVGFSADSSVFLGGNKFGDVLVATTAEEEGAIAVETLLGHYCSILTSLRLSEDGRLLATTDRDSKIRVSLMPKNPMLGAHEIQTYCFGHTSFVQCGSFVPGPGTPKLVTGGGDGTVRLWNAEEGALLCTLEIPASGAEDGSAEEHGGARHVLALACSQDGRHAVVIMDRDPSLRVLAVDAAAGKVEMGAICTLPGLPIVSDVVCDFEGRFWLVGGPLDGEATAAIVVCAQLSPEGQLTVCEPEPLGAEAKEKLQQCASAPADVKPSSFLPSYLAKKRKWEDAEKRHAERAGKPDS